MTRSRRRFSFKFNKAFVGRIAAVGLFVCLGSFAVVQSIRQAQNTETDPSGEETSDSTDNDSSSAGKKMASNENQENISKKPPSFDPSSLNPDGNSADQVPAINGNPQGGEPASQFGSSGDFSPGFADNKLDTNISNPSLDSTQTSQLPPLINGQSGANDELPMTPPNSSGSPFGDLPPLENPAESGEPGGIAVPPPNSSELPNQLPDQPLNSNTPGSFNPGQFGGNPAATNQQPSLPAGQFGSSPTPPLNGSISSAGIEGNQLPPSQNNRLPENSFPNPSDTNNFVDSDNTLPPGNSKFNNDLRGGNSLPSENTLPTEPPLAPQTGQLASSQNQNPLPPNFTGGNLPTAEVKNLNLPTENDSTGSHLPSQPISNGTSAKSEVQPVGNQETPIGGGQPGQFGNLDNRQSPVTRPNIPNFEQTGSLTQRNSQPSADPPSVLESSTNQNSNSIPGTAIPANNVNHSTTPVNARNVSGIQAPSLTLQKIAPREVTINQEADFQLIVRNVGRTTAENVQVFDQVPTNTQIVKLDPQPVTSENGKVTWNLGSIKPGGQKIVRMKLKPVAPGNVGSVAKVTFTASAGATTRITRPQLKLTHRAAPQTLLGHDAVLQIEVENTGDGPATNVVIQEKVPSNFIFQMGGRKESEIEYSVGTLGPGQKRTAVLRLRATSVGKAQNRLVAHAAGGLTAQHQIDLNVVAPDLGVEAKGPRRRFLGKPAEYEFTIKNSGTAAATNVDLVAQLPRGFRFIKANHFGQYRPQTHTVSWSLEKLDAGVMGKVNLTAVPIQNGQQEIAFQARADLGQKPSTQVGTLVYQIAELYFDINDENGTLEQGAETVYTIRVVNQGAKVAKNVNVNVEFAAGIKPVQIDQQPGNQALGQSIKLPSIASLGPRQQKIFRIRAKGVAAGEHRVVASLSSDDRKSAIRKEESTTVFSDQ